jgi:hypothetical protein
MTMRRREFIARLGSAADGGEGAAGRCGEGDPERQAASATFGNALQDLGWTDGRKNLRVVQQSERGVQWAGSP